MNKLFRRSLWRDIPHYRNDYENRYDSFKNSNRVSFDTLPRHVCHNRRALFRSEQRLKGCEEDRKETSQHGESREAINNVQIKYDDQNLPSLGLDLCQNPNNVHSLVTAAR